MSKHRVRVVAEAAQSHEGSPDRLLSLIAAAHAAGADGIKVQAVFAEDLATPGYEHFPTFLANELSPATWKGAGRLADDLGIPLYLDVFGVKGAAAAEAAQPHGVKVHATDLANPELLQWAASASPPEVILGIGGAELGEIEEATQVLAGKNLVLMHGFQGYPTSTAAYQLQRLKTLARLFPTLTIGFADHLPAGSPERLWAAATAVGAGATVIEKHMVLGACLGHLDSDAALNPDEMATFCRRMHFAAEMVGEVDDSRQDFGMSDEELRYRASTRKVVVATRSLNPDDCLSRADLTLKRVGKNSGDLFRDVRPLLGRTVNSAISEDQPVQPSDLTSA